MAHTQERGTVPGPLRLRSHRRVRIFCYDGWACGYAAGRGRPALRKAANWADFSESFPAFLILIGIPLSFSIADGLALGIISYPIVKLFTGKGRQVGWLGYALAILLLGYFVFVRSRLG